MDAPDLSRPSGPTRLSAILAVVIVFGASTVSVADDKAVFSEPVDLERRVRELEVIAGLRGGELGSADEFIAPELTLPDNSAKRGGSELVLPITAGWKNGFYLRSDDESFVLRITGQIQADLREFLRAEDETDIDTFLVRRARLGIEATMLKYYEFRLLPDFGQGQTRVQDAYLNIHYCDEIQFEFGRFKQPVSYEQLIQDRFVPTLERSMIDQLMPARDVGVMIHGQKLFDNRIDYAAAISNGAINGDFDSDGRMDFAGRLAVRPFATDCSDSWLYGLQLGVSGSIGSPHEPASPNVLRTPASVPWFRFNPTVQADGLRTRLVPEIAYFRGSFGFAAQYVHEEQEFAASATGPGSELDITVPMDGFYVLATYLLTGEQRTTYSQAIEPLAPFDPHQPCAAPGAWEVVARVSQLHLDDRVFAAGLGRLSDPTRFSSGATELTFGVNWYLNAWVRAQMNWEHAGFSDPVRLGNGSDGLMRHQDSLVLRFQIIF